ncbi:MAG TPA: LamG-like jellyroll fold domain-containing protein [Polyangia bacterium]|nr:LamG-like jellyroll fold domain-containing protein [Polyangia bacterium]HVY36343.1 LamG-like jellyroll fold domain-containing protein [Polyangia bacterium]
MQSFRSPGRAAVWAFHAICLLAAAPAAAATKTWAATFFTGNNWSTGSAWSPSGVPGSGDDVVFDSGTSNRGCNIDANVSVNSITVQGNYTGAIAPTGTQSITTVGGISIAPTSSGGSFKLSSGFTTVGGAFARTNNNMSLDANGGTLILNSSGSVSHSTTGATLANVAVGINVSSGLVGYWKLDETTGTSAADSSGSGNTGTWSSGGVTRTASVPSAITFGDPEAITLDGSSGYVTLGAANLPANNAAQSISLWYKGAPNGGNENMISLSNGASSAVQLGFRGSTLIAWSWGGGTLISTTATNDTNWHHAVYTYDGTTDRIYVDGTLQASGTSTHQTASVTTAYLGTYNAGGELFAGSLDDVRVYNRAISAAEVAILAAGSSPSVTAGTHTFSTAVTMSGSFTLSTGTVTGGNAINVGGSWTNTGATFSGTGTVTLQSTSAGTVLQTNGSAFSALTVNGSGGGYTLADNLSVTNALTITAGTLAAGAKTITAGSLSDSGTLTGNGAITVNGNLNITSSGSFSGSAPLSVAGNWTNAGTYNGTGGVTLIGTSAGQTITSGGGRFASLTVNGAGGTYTLQDRLSVPNGTVLLSNGTLALGANTARVGTISLGSGALSTGTGTVIVDPQGAQTLGATSFYNLRFEDGAETNLVGYWKLDEGTGTTVYDYSGNGNTGTLSSSGVTWQSAVPSGITFDDPKSVALSSGYASLGATNMPASNAAQTISCWVNLTSTAGNQNFVALTGPGFVQVGLRGGKYTVWPSGAATSLVGPSASTGGWHHVVYTYDGTTDIIYVDGAATSGSYTHQTGTPTAAWIGTFDGGSELMAGSIDDVRVYNVALTASQVAQLAAGRYAGTGGQPTVKLGGNTTVTNQLTIDNGVLDANGKTMAATLAAAVNVGTYNVNSAAQTFSGGLTVQPAGTLTLANSGGSVLLGSGTTLTIDGTLNASSTGAAIKSVSGTYTFTVGSSASATPTVNVSGLAVQNAAAGMQIGFNTSSSPIVTRLDKVAFSNGSGSQLLLINAKSLYLSSSGCSFDAGVTATTTKSVKVAGNGTSDGETRVVFGGATCASGTTCQASKSDDDANNDGIGDNPGTNGAVAQFVRAAANDTAGSIVGFPTAAFDWSTFNYYSTYAAFHNAAGGTTDAIYVRDEAGNALYSWTVPSAGETITGTPQWTTIGGTHYVFVATSAGKVYRLIDTATGTTSGTLSLDTGGAWSTNPFNCSCTISTPLTMDASNLYWGSTTATKNFWTLGISNESNPSPVSITPVVTNTALTMWTISGTSYAFMGVVGNVLKISTLAQSITATNASPVSASVLGRIIVGYNKSGLTRVYAGDDGGTMWAIDPGSNFATLNGLWHYTTGNAIKSSPYYDHDTDTIQYGTQGGTIIVLDGSGNALNSSYPYTPAGGSGDAITASPLYYGGILVVGSTGGKLYFLDRNTGTTPGVSIVNQFYFGPNESVSGVGYDPTVNRYMVTTANASSNDGRIYYFDQVTDPTASFL